MTSLTPSRPSTTLPTQTHTRARSNTSTSATTTAGSTPHGLSLKVLRLSRPTAATQTALPTAAADDDDGAIPAAASRAWATNTADADGSGAGAGMQASSSPLTPVLNLPHAFGAAYVGEWFSCALCVNCSAEGEGVSGVVVRAELTTPGIAAAAAAAASGSGRPSQDGSSTAAGAKGPGGGMVLELEGGGGQDRGGGEGEGEGEGEGVEMKAGSTLQRIVRHELTEEGGHQMAVTVTYAEGGAGEGGRRRTFRKLYQFVAQPLVAVRSKVTGRGRKGGGDGRRQWVLEAQMENVGETSAVLETVYLKEKEGVESFALNSYGGGERVQVPAAAVVLKPQDVEQVMFLVREAEGSADAAAAAAAAAAGGRVPLGQLRIEWRSAMGERGSLTTGWLASRG